MLGPDEPVAPNSIFSAHGKPYARSPSTSHHTVLRAFTESDRGLPSTSRVSVVESKGLVGNRTVGRKFEGPSAALQGCKWRNGEADCRALSTGLAASMTRAANLFHYCSSRAYSSSEDLKDGARRLFGIAYEIIWAPVTVPKAAISYGLSFPLTRALVLLPLQFVQRARSVGAPGCYIVESD